MGTKQHNAIDGADLHEPKAHASSHYAAGADAVDHDQLTNYVADQHIDWTNASDNLSTSGYGSFNAGIQIGESSLANDVSDNLVFQADGNLVFETNLTFFDGSNTNTLINVNGSASFNEEHVNVDFSVHGNEMQDLFKAQSSNNHILMVNAAVDISSTLASFTNLNIETTGQVTTGLLTPYADDSIDFGSPADRWSVGFITTIETEALRDTSVVTSIDVDNRQLLDSTATYPTVDWGNNQLNNNSGNLVLDWNSYLLYANDSADIILDWSTVGLAEFGDSNVQTTGTYEGASINLTDEETGLQLDGLTMFAFKATDNLFIGYAPNLNYANITGSANTLVGSNIYQWESLTSGDNNFAFGNQALRDLSTGDNNIGIGVAAGKNINSGNSNICIGGNAGEKLTDGVTNIFIGKSAGSLIATGIDQNTVIGSTAGQDLQSSLNVLIGSLAGRNVTTGLRQAIIGADAGTTITTGDYNVLIGYNANTAAADTDYAIVLGPNQTAVSNEFVIASEITSVNWSAASPTLLLGSGNVTLGSANDSTISHDGDSLNIIANAVVATDDLNIEAENLNFILEATSEDGLLVDGDTNPFSTPNTKGSAIRVKRTYDWSTNQMGTAEALALRVRHESSGAVTGGLSKTWRPFFLEVENTGTIINDSASASNIFILPIQQIVTDTGTWDTSSTGALGVGIRGSAVSIVSTPVLSDSGNNTPVSIYATIGQSITLNTNPASIDGTWSIQNYGLTVNITGTSEGSSVNRGIFVEKVSGADLNYGYYDTSDATWWYRSDIGEMRLGESSSEFNLGARSTYGYITMDAALRIGNETTNYSNFSPTGTLSFIGTAEFHIPRVSVSAEPTPSTNELQVWRDPDDSKTYLIYNDTDEGVRKIELT